MSEKIKFDPFFYPNHYFYLHRWINRSILSGLMGRGLDTVSLAIRTNLPLASINSILKGEGNPTVVDYYKIIGSAAALGIHLKMSDHLIDDMSKLRVDPESLHHQEKTRSQNYTDINSSHQQTNIFAFSPKCYISLHHQLNHLILKWLEERRLSEAHLALKMFLSYHSIVDILKGEKNPSVKDYMNLLRSAGKLNVHIDIKEVLLE